MIFLYNEQKKAMKATPYNPDAVQAYGVAFAYHYNLNKESLCSLCNIPEEEFDYNKRHHIIQSINSNIKETGK